MEDNNLKNITGATTAMAEPTKDEAPVMTASTSNTIHSISHFESLPAEDRVMIWKLALPICKEATIIACDDQIGHVRTRCYVEKEFLRKLTSAFDPLPLVLINHMTRREILPLLELRKIFSFNHVKCAGNFLSRSSTKPKALIKESHQETYSYTAVNSLAPSTKRIFDDWFMEIINHHFHGVGSLTRKYTQVPVNCFGREVREVEVNGPIESQSEGYAESWESE